MKFLEKLIKKTNILQRTIGLKIEQLNKLVEQLVPHWNNAEKARKSKISRKRKIGAGHPYKYQTLREKVIIVLLYYKLYLTQEFLGTIVDLDQANVCRLLKKLLPLIEKAADPELASYLEEAKQVYEAMEKVNNWGSFLQRNPDLRDVSTDATEQACHRSKDYETQKQHYSGKKKNHTLKTQISVSSSGRILDVSKTYPGSVHDKTVIDKEETIKKFPQKTCLRFDSGYQGIKDNNPDHYIVLPTKKPKGKELSSLAKQHNRTNSKRRVISEHVYSRIKKFRVLGNLYRGSLESYNQIFRSIASILNFKLANPVMLM